MTCPIEVAHRRTWPDYRANDRVVLRDGVKVARVYQHEHGPQAGSWAWLGQWAGCDNSGVTATLDGALDRDVEYDPRAA